MFRKKFGTLSNIKFVYKFLFEKSKHSFFFLLSFILTTIIASVLITYLPSLIVFIIENNFGIPILIATVIAIAIAYAIFQFIIVYLSNYLRLEYSLVRANFPIIELQRHSLEMDYEVYEKKETKDALAKAMEAVGSDWQGFQGIYQYFPEIVIAIIGLLIFGITSIFVSWYIFLIVLAMFFINLFVLYFVTKKDIKINEDISKYQNKLTYLSHVSRLEKEGKDIRNYSLKNKLINIMDSYYKILKKHVFKLELFWFLPDIEVSVFTLIRDLLAYAILIAEIIAGQIGVSEFVALIATITAFNSYIDRIVLNLDATYKSSVETSYYREYFEIGKENNKTNCLDSKILDEAFEIEIKNLSFKYDGSEKYIFRNFSLKIKRGEKIAFVGLNGAGKTTLAKLLTGLYKPTEGEILVNGNNIKDFKKEDYFKYVSIVNQDVIPFAFTIKENIVGALPFDKTKFENVLNDSGLLEKVNSLTKKEETYLTQNLSEDGINLSGGETQKMLLARALYKNSPFLILDEPTAALDPLAEEELYMNYNSLMKNKTSIFISHRLSSTQFCDKIYYLEDGRIIEEGTHAELMNLKGKYFEVFNVQAKYYREKEEE